MQYSSFEVLQWCVYAMNETTEPNAEIPKVWDTGCNLEKKKNKLNIFIRMKEWKLLDKLNNPHKLPNF